MAPSVSVIVPAFNYARYLPAALDSALTQDYPAELLEVVVVDDGSTDETPAVLAGYGDRIRAVRRENGGLNAATSTGIAVASGELLTFLDADDTWPRDRVRRLARVLERRSEIRLAYGDMAVVDDDGRMLNSSMAGVHKRRSGRILGPLLTGNFVSAGAMMVRAADAELYHPIPDFAPYQDWWIACRLAAVGPVAYVNAVVNRYRSHGANMNLDVDQEGLMDLKRSTLRFRRWMIEAIDPALVAPGDIVRALEQLDEHVAILAVHEPQCLEDLLPADRSAALQALEAASAALDDGDAALALAWLARSAVRDVDFGEPRTLIAQLAPIVSTEAAAALAG